MKRRLIAGFLILVSTLPAACRTSVDDAYPLNEVHEAAWQRNWASLRVGMSTSEVGELLPGFFILDHKALGDVIRENGRLAIERGGARLTFGRRGLEGWTWNGRFPD